ncbi:1,6-anhydro-N-acetylmuramyl-L-alanine amidase AmpD [Thioalkalivibrio sp. XN8]|uniref:1,6-anhydro-N-acetylmuramyl-L-alanine amidase AmpD n=1 Tax=Thioalkalivibrio sp. XN8 TaxID=2712863 RepID=UPI0013EB87A2|nr:1,6-anhydro-N-acetylmuramyl-L-alanine amidase AmpD [Thioalkalivibrio sp. XN8]NGP52026.1 1,6-anhydro-N-acetylmuramyl-L-alanine amidase AmpD [Thioalkalivibrio sp. XN8]
MAKRKPRPRFTIDRASGLLAAARQVPSPNHNDRPAGATLDLIVVHNISLPPGEFGGPWIDALFTNQLNPRAHPYFTSVAPLQVSAHLLIRRDGELVQYVPFHRRAWHAGASSWQGRENCNDFSVGIELEGTDDGAYTTAQYRRLAVAIRALCRTYPTLAPERLAGHSDIAPGRKTDPGPSFDWDRLRRWLKPRRYNRRRKGAA